MDKGLLDAYQSMRDLTSRVEMLESHPVLVSTNAPTREEEVQPTATVHYRITRVVMPGLLPCILPWSRVSIPRRTSPIVILL